MKLAALSVFAVFSLIHVQIASTATVLNGHNNAKQFTEDEIAKILDDYNKESINYCNLNENAEWNVQTNVGNEEIQKEYEKVSSEYAEFQKKHWTNVWSQVSIDEKWSESTIRQLKALKELGSAALNESDFVELLGLTSNMLGIYSQATICPYKQPNCTTDEALTLDPEIEQIMAHSVDYDELAYVWNEWREKTGKLMRNDYKKYVDVMNTAARANDYEDASKWWQSKYEDKNFVEKVDQLWTEIEPLYNELHTYVKYRLFEIYGNKMNYSNPNLPAHLMGNMWAQAWDNLYDKTKPFPNASLIDVSAKLQELGYDSRKMFELSDEFYLSMGLINNSISYTCKAIIDKPSNRTIVCHASAWDFCDGTDYRIKMCTKINMKDFTTIHHEMGHIQYFMQYRDLPLALRGGANPGFHEAVGDTIALAVATPQHLQKIGLLDNYADTEEDNININALYSMALKRLAFLPFGLMIDKWRWDVFSGNVSEKNWNKHWWMLREKYQKISSPFERTEMDFDPGAKYHVPANSQYIAYFIAHVVEFQMYQSLCVAADEYPAAPLHKCDFYHSLAAGTKLSNGLKLGTSKHWSEALSAITGSKDLSSASLLEYFKPLYDYLKEKNSELMEEHKVRLALETYNFNASKECNNFVRAEWNTVTDLQNIDKEEAYIQAAEQNAKFKKLQYHQLIKPLIGKQFSDEKIQRQIKLLSNLDIDILDDNSLNNLTSIVLKMVQIYNTVKVCPYDNQLCDLNVDGMYLDPDLTNKMASSTNYNELQYFWQQWYDNSGKSIRTHYKPYVQLMNKAAQLNGFRNADEMWQSHYEDLNFGEKMTQLWTKLQPLYDELHKFVVRKLSKIYPDKIQANDTHLPAHVLGNMWAQSWDHLYNRMKPFNGSDLDVTANMKAQNYTALKIFEMANEFYESLGMPSAETSYTGDAIIERPTDRLIVCHPQAYDFCDGIDYRIRMCTKISQSNFKTAHHEMGHIEYFMLYKDQPIPFRNGANPGFHEAIGDAIALSFNTPTHLEKIGLLKDYANTDEDIINFLFKTALKRVAFLPFSLLIDTYRWDIFNGKVNESNWNQHWEYLREKYQKIKSPVPRNETNFDAGGKIHVAANGQYINYFFSHIFEYQLHKSLCISAGEYQPNSTTSSKPLSQCDIYQSKEAGDKLKAGLKIGQSQHWFDTLEMLTGDRELKADALLEYYDPLMKYLMKVNQEEI